MELTSRERVSLALNHEEPDRVPIAFGAEGATSMLVPAYENLKRHLGIDNKTRLFSRAFQYARIDEEVMAYFRADLRPLVCPVSARCAPVDGPDDTFTDCWGITYQRPPGGYYYDMISQPLQGALTPKDLEEYPWPDPEMMLDLSGLADRARQLHREGQYAIVGIPGGPSSIFELAYCLRGMPEFMMDLAANPEMAHALLRRLTDLAKATTAQFLREVGDYIDIFRVGDDLGMQTGPFISPRMYREMVKPYMREVAWAILTESGLSFLGYGVQPPVPSWGNILTDAQEFMSLYPWVAIFPGFMIFITVISINFIGDALRDALDPRKVVGLQRGQ